MNPGSNFCIIFFMETAGAREGAWGAKVYRNPVRCILYMVTQNTRSLICVLTIVFTLFLAPFSGAEELNIVGAPYEPFIFVDRDGKLKGFDVDLINLLCTSSGYTCHIKLTTFKDALDSLRNGSADVAIGAIYITEERKREFLFTEPYLDTGLVTVVRTDRDIDISDLKGRTIGVKLGATGERIAEKLALSHKGLSIRRFLSTEDSFEALARGEVDLVLNDYLNSVYLILQRYPGQLKVIKGLWGPVFFQKTQLAYPIRKGRPDIHEKFNQVLSEVKKSGLIERFKQNWFGIMPSWNYIKTLQTTVLVFAGAVVFITFLFFIYRNRQLRKHSQNLQGLLKELPGAVFVLQNGRIVYSNPTAREMFNSPTLDLPVETVLSLKEEQKQLLRDTTPLKAGSFELRHKGRFYACYYNPIEFNNRPSVQLLLFDITAERTANESLRRLYRFQEAYNEILRVCTEAETIEALLREVLEELLAIDFLGTEGRGMVFRYKEELKALELVVSHNVPEHIIEKCKKVNEGDCLCGLAIKERRIMFIPQGAYPGHSEEDDFPHNHYLIPVYDNEGVYALFNLYTKKETIEPQEEGFAMAVATAVRNGI
ncbi:MAG: hypothetical protein D6778_00100 [Nitrospirae bacterium]|nr:MAG: hypothetical protein D6778_00100 [Nitrospirota bacterium]